MPKKTKKSKTLSRAQLEAKVKRLDKVISGLQRVESSGMKKQRAADKRARDAERGRGRSDASGMRKQRAADRKAASAGTRRDEARDRADARGMKKQRAADAKRQPKSEPLRDSPEDADRLSLMKSYVDGEVAPMVSSSSMDPPQGEMSTQDMPMWDRAIEEPSQLQRLGQGRRVLERLNTPNAASRTQQHIDYRDATAAGLMQSPPDMSQQVQPSVDQFTQSLGQPQLMQQGQIPPMGAQFDEPGMGGMTPEGGPGAIQQGVEQFQGAMGPQGLPVGAQQTPPPMIAPNEGMPTIPDSAARQAYEQQMMQQALMQYGDAADTSGMPTGAQQTPPPPMGAEAPPPDVAGNANQVNTGDPELDAILNGFDMQKMQEDAAEQAKKKLVKQYADKIADAATSGLPTGAQQTPPPPMPGQ